MNPKPTPGRIVHYTLSEADAERITQRRKANRLAESLLAQLVKERADDRSRVGKVAEPWPEHARLHAEGNNVAEGDIVPVLVTAVWSPTCINGLAILDGDDPFWVTSASQGSGPHTWQWPTRESDTSAPLNLPPTEIDPPTENE